MSLPAVKPLSIYEGDDTIFKFQWLGPDGYPVKIDRSQIRLAAKRNYDEDVPLLVSHAQIVNADNGIFAIVIPSAASKQLHVKQPLDLIYDVQTTMPSGWVHTLFRGPLTILPEVD